jgi:hypothetical protein
MELLVSNAIWLPDTLNITNNNPVIMFRRMAVITPAEKNLTWDLCRVEISFLRLEIIINPATISSATNRLCSVYKKLADDISTPESVCVIFSTIKLLNAKIMKIMEIALRINVFRLLSTLSVGEGNESQNNKNERPSGVPTKSAILRNHKALVCVLVVSANIKNRSHVLASNVKAVKERLVRFFGLLK